MSCPEIGRSQNHLRSTDLISVCTNAALFLGIIIGCSLAALLFHVKSIVSLSINRALDSFCFKEYQHFLLKIETNWATVSRPVIFLFYLFPNA